MKLFLAAGVVILAGCVADGPQRQSRRQPADALPAKLVPTASVEFTDTDANRYRDSATVVIYIMGDIPAYHLPIKAEGRFDLSLEDSRGKVVASWAYDKAQTAAALSGLQPGPGFVFGLDFRKSSLGTDVTETPEATLVVVFTPLKGDPIRTRTSAPIIIGPSNRR